MIPLAGSSTEAAIRAYIEAKMAARSPAEMPSPPSELQEGEWDEGKHPRAHGGKFASKGEHALGITPFREGEDEPRGFYESGKWRAFNADLQRSAEAHHVRLLGVAPASGVWQGGREPSAIVRLRDGDDAVRAVADELGAKYDQDGVLRFKANGKGDAFRFVSAEKVDAEKVKVADALRALPGATVRPDGKLEVVAIDPADRARARALFTELGLHYRYHRGDGELRLAGDHYKRWSAQGRSWRDTDSGSVRGDAASRPAGARDGAGRPGLDARGRQQPDVRRAEDVRGEADDPGPQELAPQGWQAPPPPVGKQGERHGAGGYSSDLAYGTNTQLGRTGERAFQAIVGGDILHPKGKGEQSPLDVRFGDYGFEVKAVSTKSLGYKATPKPYEQAQKEQFARELGLHPALAIVVVDSDSGMAHAYFRDGLTGGRLSEKTGWRYLGSTELDKLSEAAWGELAEGLWSEVLHPRGNRGRFRTKVRVASVPTRNWLGGKVRLSRIRRRGMQQTPLTMLVTTGQPDMDRFASPALGRLLVPGMQDAADATGRAGVPFAADNGGFFGVPVGKYKEMIEKLRRMGLRPLWVTAPDVIHHLPDGTVMGDWEGTARRFEQWQPYLAHMGMPVALVAQNGLDSPEGLAWLDQRWDKIDAIFLGGNNDFKLGPGGAKITRLAQEHGKLVHMGRVSTAQRMAYARDVLGVDSMDGSQWAKFKDTHLGRGLSYASTADAPPTRIGREWVKAAREARDGVRAAWPKAPDVHEHPQWPRGDWPEALTAAAQEPPTVFFQDLSDALYRVGLSDYWHLHFTPGRLGFTVDLTDPRQPQLLAGILGLPEPEVDGSVASWPGVGIVPGGGDEDDREPLQEAPWDETHHHRGWHGRFAPGHMLRVETHGDFAADYPEATDWHQVDLPTVSPGWIPPEGVKYSPEVKAIGGWQDAERYLRGRGLTTVALEPQSTEKGRNLAKDADWFRQIAQAITDAQDRYPALRTGANPLTTLALYSNQPNQEALTTSDLAAVWAVTGRSLIDPRNPTMGHDPPLVPKPSHTAIVINDHVIGLQDRGSKYNIALQGLMSHASVSLYGKMMHELGHAVAAATDFSDIAHYMALRRAHIDPVTASEISEYGASAPAELWAEVFATINTDSDLARLRGLHPDAAARIDELRRQPEATEPLRMLVIRGPLLRDILAQARRNVAANKWLNAPGEAVQEAWWQEVRHPRGSHGRWVEGLAHPDVAAAVHDLAERKRKNSAMILNAAKAFPDHAEVERREQGASAHFQKSVEPARSRLSDALAEHAPGAHEFETLRHYGYDGLTGEELGDGQYRAPTRLGTLYHVAPLRLRDTIASEGLRNPGKRSWPMNDQYEPGLYAWDTLADARHYRDQVQGAVFGLNEPMDIWEMHGVPASLDQFSEQGLREMGYQGHSHRLHPDAVPPRFLSLHEPGRQLWGQTDDDAVGKRRAEPVPDGPFYHGTNRALRAGDVLHGTDKPNESREFFDPDAAYFTTGAHMAERYAVTKAGRSGEGEPHVYEVRPRGGTRHDEEYVHTGWSSDQYVAPEAEVVREVPLPGLSHWDGGLKRGPRVQEAAIDHRLAGVLRRRFPKGARFGGRFMAVGQDSPAVAHLRQALPRWPEPPAVTRLQRRGVMRHIRGVRERIPEQGAWRVRRGGHVFSSPVGSTLVYRDGQLAHDNIKALHPDLDPFAPTKPDVADPREALAPADDLNVVAGDLPARLAPFEPDRYESPRGQLQRRMRRLGEGEELRLPHGKVVRVGATFHLQDDSGQTLSSAGTHQPGLLAAEAFGPYHQVIEGDEAKGPFPYKGKGRDAFLLGPQAVPVGSPDRSLRARYLEGAGARDPYQGDVLKPQELRDFGEAARRVTAEFPEIVGGEGDNFGAVGLGSIEFLSGMDAASRVELLGFGMVASTAYAPGWKGQKIILNDLEPNTLGQDPNLAPSTRTWGGAATHELGHAFARWAGLGDQVTMVAALAKFGLGVGPLGEISAYAAADPREGFGELFGMRYTPGFHLPPDVSARFDRMIAWMRTGKGRELRNETNPLLSILLGDK